MRVGIVARDRRRGVAGGARALPEDRTGQITHKVAMKVSDSHWHEQLSQRVDEGADGASNPYWLGPFHNYKTFCPYLVGDHDTVADQIKHYRPLGATTFILDIRPRARS